MPPRNLVIIGGRGSGKSSICKRLARRNRNFLFFSLDALIRYEADALSIPEIVEREGCAGFREREYSVVQKLSNFHSGALLDCGGGVVVDLDNGVEEIFSQRKVEALRRHGWVVYLRREPEYLLDRIGGDENRPSLSDTRSFLDVMERREPWYRQAADLVLDCNGLAKGEITETILDSFFDLSKSMESAE